VSNEFKNILGVKWE